MSTLNLSFLPVRPEWLAQSKEEVLDPDRAIIDAHNHLWANPASGRYLLDEFADDLQSGHRVLATVFVQCGWNHRIRGPEAFRPVGEVEAVAAVAALSATGAYGPAQIAAGIVGLADPRAPELPTVLDALAAAGQGRLRGIRYIAATDPHVVQGSLFHAPAGLMLDGGFQAGLRELGRRALSFDAWQFHPQLGELLVAARAAPATRIVIDHCGGPLRVGAYAQDRDGVHRSWLADMRALAGCPNVSVKLGGLAMPIGGFDYDKADLPPTSARLAQDWRPWVEPLIEMFTPQRCMFEANFPVDKGMCSYHVTWNAFKRLASGASEQDKDALFSLTAASVYAISPDGLGAAAN